MHSSSVKIGPAAPTHVPHYMVRASDWQVFLRVLCTYPVPDAAPGAADVEQDGRSPERHGAPMAEKTGMKDTCSKLNMSKRTACGQEAWGDGSL